MVLVGLSFCDPTVVAGIAAAQSVAVPDAIIRPVRGTSMAIFADIRGCRVASRTAFCRASIVARRTARYDPRVREVGRSPGRRPVAGAAVLRSCNMVGCLACRLCPIVTTGAGSSHL
jgi:hypothetical protein